MCILTVVKGLQNHVPDDLVNTIMDFTGNPFEETKINYAELIITNIDESKYIYDINTKNEYPHIPPHRRTRENFHLESKFYFCECGKFFNRSYQSHSHHEHFIPIPFKKLTSKFKVHLIKLNQRKIESLRSRNQVTNIVDQNRPDFMEPRRIMNPWNQRIALYNIKIMKIIKYKHTINSQSIKKDKN